MRLCEQACWRLTVALKVPRQEAVREPSCDITTKT